MSKRVDFSNEVASVKATTDSEVASLLKLVGQETTSETPSAAGRNANRSKPMDGGTKSSLDHHGDIQTHSSNRSRHTYAKDSESHIILEQVTTRLTSETNARLTEAALMQKLAKTKPDTRQEIMETAIRRWLAENSYGAVQEHNGKVAK